MRLWPAAVITVLLLSILAIPQPCFASPSPILIQGSVVLEGTDITLTGITVSLAASNGTILNTTKTDVNGHFEFICPSANITLTFTHPAFISRSFPLVIGSAGLNTTFGLSQALTPFAIYVIKDYNYTKLYNNITGIDCRTDFLFRFNTSIDPSSFELIIFSEREKKDEDQDGIVNGNLTYYQNNNTMRFKPTSRMANQRLQNYPEYLITIKSSLNDSFGSPMLYFDFHLWFVNAELDSDRDKIPDYRDMFPLDPTEWLDTDTDGVGENTDAFPSDITQWKDSDGDRHGDNRTGNEPDVFPNDPNEWQDTDGDGMGDNTETDDDNDGFDDKIEIQLGFDPKDAASKPGDVDDDGIPDALDSDADGDGYSNTDEKESGTDPYDPDSHPTIFTMINIIIAIIILLTIVLITVGILWFLAKKRSEKLSYASNVDRSRKQKSRSSMGRCRSNRGSQQNKGRKD